MKKKVSVSIDVNVFKKAKDLGLDVSKVCENQLIVLINAMESSNGKNNAFSLTQSSLFGKEKSEVRSPGFEPGIISLEGLVWRGGVEDWVRFRAHLAGKNYRGGWGTVLYNYAQEYSDCLFKRDLSRVQGAKSRLSILKALSALAKFTGCYEDWQKLLKDYGLKWIVRSKDDVFIDRLTGVSDPEEVWVWIREVKDARPELRDLLDLLALSGLRFVESVNSYNLIVELTRKGEINLDRAGKDYHSGYFNRESLSLEHFWPPFRTTFLRSTKKAFVSFVPAELVDKIGKRDLLPEPGAISKLVAKRGLPARFSDVREAQGTFMTKYLKESEISFLHGRVTSSVFMSNYFNPSLITDLKARAFQGIGEIQEKIK